VSEGGSSQELEHNVNNAMWTHRLEIINYNPGAKMQEEFVTEL
jgi:hypothetical protein